jgi:hypothetical protein
MIPTSFEYTRPSSVDEAVYTLRDAGEDAKVLAGGQSLIPVLRLRLAAPSTLVDLGGIADLAGIREDGDSLVIGAMTSHAEVADSGLVRQHAPMVAEAAQSIGDPQVRHLGTFYEVAHPKRGKVKAQHRPLRIDGSREIDFRPPPDLGEHTEEILAELRKKGVL